MIKTFDELCNEEEICNYCKQTNYGEHLILIPNCYFANGGDYTAASTRKSPIVDIFTFIADYNCTTFTASIKGIECGPGKRAVFIVVQKAVALIF